MEVVKALLLSAVLLTGCSKGFIESVSPVHAAFISTRPANPLQLATIRKRCAPDSFCNSTPPQIKTFTNLQSGPGWKSSGQLAPNYADCDANCPGVTWSMTGNIFSFSGNAVMFNLGGTTPYSDVLFYDQLIGQFSTQNLPDLDQTLIPTLNNFSYEADFYVPAASLPLTQALEFDINMFPGNSVGMTWGTECRIAGGNEWDIWDNLNSVWVPTGFACHPLADSWNHVVVTAQRGPNNTVVYESIVLNGTSLAVKKSYPPFTVPTSWYGITVNYQMDGNYKQDSIVSYLDNFTFKYWQ